MVRRGQSGLGSGEEGRWRSLLRKEQMEGCGRETRVPPSIQEGLGERTLSTLIAEKGWRENYGLNLLLFRMKKQPERPGTCPRSFIQLVDIHKTPLLLYWAPTGRIPLISITTATPFYPKGSGGSPRSWDLPTGCTQEAELVRGPGLADPAVSVLKTTWPMKGWH